MMVCACQIMLLFYGQMISWATSGDIPLCQNATEPVALVYIIMCVCSTLVCLCMRS